MNIYKILVICIISFGVLESAVAELSFSNRLCSNETNIKSLNSDKPVKIEFTNQLTEVVNIYWINFEGNRELYQNLSPQSTFIQDSFVTHPWLINSSTNNCYGIFVLESDEEEVNINIILEKPQISVKNGFIKLDTTEGFNPNVQDCLNSDHYGRMVFDEINGALFICGKVGWLTVQGN